MREWTEGLSIIQVVIGATMIKIKSMTVIEIRLTIVFLSKPIDCLFLDQTLLFLKLSVFAQDFCFLIAVFLQL